MFDFIFVIVWNKSNNFVDNTLICFYFIITKTLIIFVIIIF